MSQNKVKEVYDYLLHNTESFIDMHEDLDVSRYITANIIYLLGAIASDEKISYDQDFHDFLMTLPEDETRDLIMSYIMPEEQE